MRRKPASFLGFFPVLFFLAAGASAQCLVPGDAIVSGVYRWVRHPMMVGGRRTAAIVAAQFLKRIPCISTVYAGSSEARALIRISERGVSRAILMKFSAGQMHQIAEVNHILPRTLKRNYAVAHEGQSSICIFEAVYSYTSRAQPSEDGKLRELKSDLNWLSVSGQHILPKPGAGKYPPIPLNAIYT